MSQEHCYGVEEFTGAWYQPYESDSYTNNFRFSAGMTAWVGCDANIFAKNMVVMEGATALAAGAIAVLAAAAY